MTARSRSTASSTPHGTATSSRPPFRQSLEELARERHVEAIALGPILHGRLGLPLEGDAPQAGLMQAHERPDADRLAAVAIEDHAAVALVVADLLVQIA